MFCLGYNMFNASHFAKLILYLYSVHLSMFCFTKITDVYKQEVS